MKKMMICLLAVLVMTACKESKKEDDKKTEPVISATETKESAPTGDDAALVQWLSGKKLVSTATDPKFDMWHDLKLNADGTCTDKDNASAKWTVKQGKFVFESVMNLTKEIVKKDDTTLMFKGEIMDQTYILKPL
ncbi:MAG: hypothetical protein JNK98_07975 [Chitinophagaceae bacterium]|nr:hypothetical protein [Chitinophagaceae bacterium]